MPSRRLKKKAKKLGPLLAAVLAVALVGGYLLYDAITSKVEAACVLLVDRTESTALWPAFENLETFGRLAIEGCKERSAVMKIYYFTGEGPTLQSVSGTESGWNFQRSSKSADEAAQTLSEIMAVTPGGEFGSDIVTPLGQAAEQLRSLRRNVDNVEASSHLVILSDAYQTGTSVSVEQILGDDPNSVQPLIDLVVLEGTLPDMSGMSIEFIGASSGVVNPNGARAEAAWDQQVRSFWTRVIAEHGGSVCTFALEQTPLPNECADA